MASAHHDLELPLLQAGRGLSSPPSATADLLTLLNKTQHLLFRVDQSPPNSTLSALNPARHALVANHLISHPDPEVRLSVAACLSEITRITAPDAPFPDDTLPAVFKTIVEAFEGLDDISSRSFSKRVMMLETAARVRSCVVMLDLELDGLILDMFRSFLKTVRPGHDQVFSSMENVMTTVIEECGSESEILPELVCCLLDSVAKDNVGVLPIARRLAEKVMSNCAGNFKDLMRKVQSDRRETRGHPQEYMVSAVEPIIKMMKAVGLSEEKAKDAKAEASKAGQDILSKVEELMKMMKHQKEAKYVYDVKDNAEKSILATGAYELLSWFLDQQEASISTLESINNMMKLVELREEKAKEAKEEASKGGQDILTELEELRKLMKHEKEANDWNVGKIYAEKVILETGAQKLLSRFLSLSEERSKSSFIVQEIQLSLEARLAVAEKERAAAEQEKLDKEAWAHTLLKEQQLLMENMVEQSGVIKQEEENAKFRELLIEGGCVVDKLLDEVSLAHDYVLSLKERVGDKSLKSITETRNG